MRNKQLEEGNTFDANHNLKKKTVFDKILTKNYMNKTKLEMYNHIYLGFIILVAINHQATCESGSIPATNPETTHRSLRRSSTRPFSTISRMNDMVSNDGSILDCRPFCTQMLPRKFDQACYTRLKFARGWDSSKIDSTRYSPSISAWSHCCYRKAKDISNHSE